MQRLQSNRHHQQTNTQLFTGVMPFLSPKVSTDLQNIKFPIKSVNFLDFSATNLTILCTEEMTKTMRNYKRKTMRLNDIAKSKIWLQEAVPSS